MGLRTLLNSTFGGAVGLPGLRRDVGAHYESLSPQDEMSKSSAGLQYLTHLDVYYQHSEDGLDLDHMARDLTNVDHWNLYGSSHYVLQCVRGLAEGPAGPYYKHCGDVRHIHDFYINLVMGDQYELTSDLYPKHFPKMTWEKPGYLLKEFEKIPYYHKEGEGD